MREVTAKEYDRLSHQALMGFRDQYRLPMAIPHPDEPDVYLTLTTPGELVILDGDRSCQVTRGLGHRPGFLGRLQGPVMVTYTRDRSGCRATGGLGKAWDSKFPGAPLDLERLQEDLEEGLALRARLQGAESPVLRAAADAPFGTLDAARTAIEAGLKAAAAPAGPAASIAVALALGYSAGEGVAHHVAPLVGRELSGSQEPMLQTLGAVLEKSSHSLPVLEVAAEATAPAGLSITRQRLEDWARGEAGEALVPALLPVAAQADATLQPLLSLDPLAQTLLLARDPGALSPAAEAAVRVLATVGGLDPGKRKSLLERAVAAEDPPALLVEAVKALPVKEQALWARELAAAMAPHLPPEQGADLRFAADLASAMTPGDYHYPSSVLDKTLAALAASPSRGLLGAAADLLASLPSNDQGRALEVILDHARARGEQQAAPEVFEVLEHLQGVNLDRYDYNNHRPIVEAVLKEAAEGASSSVPAGLRVSIAALGKVPKGLQSDFLQAGLKASRHSPRLVEAADLLVFLRPLAEYKHPGDYESVRSTAAAVLEAWGADDPSVPPLTRMARAALNKVSTGGRPAVLRAVVAAGAQRSDPAWLQVGPVLEDLAGIRMRGDYDSLSTITQHAMQVLDGQATPSDQGAARSGLPNFPADTPPALRLAYEAAMKLSKETSKDVIDSAVRSLQSRGSTRAEAECAALVATWNRFSYSGDYESRNKTLRVSMDALRRRPSFGQGDSPGLAMLRAGASTVGKDSRGRFVRQAMEALLAAQDMEAGKTALFLPSLPDPGDIVADLEGSLARFETFYQGLHAGSAAADKPAGTIDEGEQEVVIGDVSLRRR